VEERGGTRVDAEERGGTQVDVEERPLNKFFIVVVQMNGNNFSVFLVNHCIDKVCHRTGENTCSVDNGGCSQLCLYRAEPRGHVCGCANGYELMVDGYGCVVPEAFLLYLHRNDIRRISLEASLNDAAIPLDGVSNARGLDYDNSDSRIYWTDVGFKVTSGFFTYHRHTAIVMAVFRVYLVSQF